MELLVLLLVLLLLLLVFFVEFEAAPFIFFQMEADLSKKESNPQFKSKRISNQLSLVMTNEKIHPSLIYSPAWSMS